MKKFKLLLILFIIFIGCEGTNSGKQRICEMTVEVALNDNGYQGCWGECQHQNINCFIVGIYKDQECTELIKTVRFDNPDTIPNEILLAETMEWPDVVWGLIYVTDCSSGNWNIPAFWDYYKCGGPFKISTFQYYCGDTLTFYYSDFDDSCVWGYVD